MAPSERERVFSGYLFTFYQETLPCLPFHFRQGRQTPFYELAKGRKIWHAVYFLPRILERQKHASPEAEYHAYEATLKAEGIKEASHRGESLSKHFAG